MDARSFLNKQDKNSFDKQTNNLDCVLCKFNMIPCCKPNLCIKKSLRPDECLELKPRSNILDSSRNIGVDPLSLVSVSFFNDINSCVVTFY